MTTRRLRAPAAALALAVVGTGALATVPAVAAPASPASVTDTAIDGGVTNTENPRVPEGASWTQHYFPAADDTGTELHADVLLPEGLAEGEQVPAIVSVGPYFGHIGALEAEGHAQAGPSSRFDALVTEGGLLDRGYALVLVDGRGFGGSTGCQDAGGPGERADVQAAIEWSAAQSWSTGSVGMYGKSYDAITGLIGNNLGLDALDAVVAQEPIWDMQRNFWSGGVPRSTIATISAIYQKSSFLPGMPDDEARYQENATVDAADVQCSLTYQDDLRATDAAFWDDRDFAEQAKGSTTPLFITQGFTEWNTEAEAVQEYLENHEGPQRGWMGPWDHVRGEDNNATDGSSIMGREGWFDEVFAFYDEHLKGAEPRTDVPNFAVQDNTGQWRGQDEWPVVDSEQTVTLPKGSYIDDGAVRSDDVRGTNSNTHVTWSDPVTEPTRLTGTPEVTFEARGYGNAMVRLYDVAPDGSATWINEQVSTVRSGSVAIELRSHDWTLAEGHQLAIEIGTIQPAEGNPHMSNDWMDTPGGEKISVSKASIDLAFDDPADDAPTEGDRADYLDTYALFAATQLEPQEGDFTLKQ